MDIVYNHTDLSIKFNYNGIFSKQLDILWSGKPINVFFNV